MELIGFALPAGSQPRGHRRRQTFPRRGTNETSLLAKIVDLYVELDQAEEKRYATEVAKEDNAEVRKMVITWEETIAASEARGEVRGEARGEARGMAKGKAEGEAKGQRLGMAQTLKNQVQRRFGDLPDWAVDRIDRADVDTLERWSYRVLDATTLDDVFQDD